RPAGEAVGDRLGGLALAGELGALLAQPALQGDHERTTALVARGEALLRRQAVDLALDGEQGVDALHRFERDRRLADAGEVEKLAPRMRPACRLDDRASRASGVVEPVEAGIGIRLHQPGI